MPWLENKNPPNECLLKTKKNEPNTKLNDKIKLRNICDITDSCKLSIDWFRSTL